MTKFQVGDLVECSPSISDPAFKVGVVIMIRDSVVYDDGRLIITVVDEMGGMHYVYSNSVTIAAI